MRSSMRTCPSCTATWACDRQRPVFAAVHQRGEASMNKARRSLLALAVAGALAIGTASADIPNNTIKLGVLSDFSGIYKDLGGEGSVVAAKLAVQDSGIEKKGIKVEIISDRKSTRLNSSHH